MVFNGKISRMVKEQNQSSALIAKDTLFTNLIAITSGVSSVR